MFFTFEFLCLSNFVSFVFCFYSSDCFFFLEFFKVVHSVMTNLKKIWSIGNDLKSLSEGTGRSAACGFLIKH